MKLSTFLFSVAFLCAGFNGFSQSEISNLSVPNVVKLGLSAGGDIEMPHGLGYNYLLSTAKDVDFDYSSLPFSDGELTKMDCDNPTTRLSVSFNPPNVNNAEWQLSLLSIEGRIDKVVYEIPEDGQHLEVNATNKETAFEVVYLLKSEIGKSFVFYGGGGTNVGYSHDGKVSVKGYLKDVTLNPSEPNDIPAEGQYIDKTYEQRNGINQRLFIQAGLSVRFLKRMEFGLECRRGFGYRATFDGPFNFTTLKRSLGFSLKYSLL